MIHLHRSCNARARADALARAVAAAQGEAGVWGFRAVEVVVPNARVERALGEALAERLGIAANLRFRRLKSALAEALPEGVHLASVPSLAARVFRVLGEVEGDPAFEVVARYLSSVSGERRRLQLAWALAERFEVHSLWAPELLDGWEQGQGELWQARVWRRLHETPDTRRRDARSLPPLVESAGLAGPRHLFGFGPIAPTWRRAWIAFARTAELHLYPALAPAPERSDSLARSASRWGRVGVDELEAWQSEAARSGVELRVHDHVSPASSSAALGAAQSGLCELSEPAPTEASEAELEGLVLAPAPSIRREAEDVAIAVWDYLAGAKGASFSDVSVLIADRDAEEAYRGHLAAAFQAAHELPNRGARRGGVPRVREAFALLLALPESSLRREDLIGLLVHPAILAASDSVERSLALEWLEQLTIIGGAERDAEGYVERELYHWDQGLRRVALGARVASSHELAPLRLGSATYLPLDLADGQGAAGGELVALARGLIADARFAANARLSLREWAGFFRAWVDALLVATDRDEERGLGDLRRAIAALAELDSGPGESTGSEGRPSTSAASLGYPAARALLERVLGPARAGARGSGVQIERLGGALHTSPRAIFVVGLGEGRFPPAPRFDGLAIEGAAAPPDERVRAQQAFLDACLSARELLCLSWVDRDAVSGEQLRASPIVRDLMGATPHELRASRARARPTTALPSATREAYVRSAREALEKSLEGRASWPKRPHELAQALPAPALDALDLRPPGLPPRPVPGSPLRVSISALHQFLLSPLQAWAKTRLQLSEDESEDPLGKREEPFGPSRMHEVVLLREVGLAALADPRAREDRLGCVREHYDRQIEIAELAGTFPTGVFLHAYREEHLSKVEAWLMNLEPYADEWKDVRVYRFGAAGGEARDHLSPPLSLNVRLDTGSSESETLRVALTGSTRPILPRRNLSFQLVDGRAREREYVRMFLDHALLAAAGLDERATWRGALCLRYREPIVERRYRTLAASRARVWLAARLAEFLGGPHAYLLPGGLTFRYLRGEAKIRARGETLGDVIRLSRDKGWSEQDSYGPITRWADLEPHPEAERVARLRWGAYVSSRMSADESEEAKPAEVSGAQVSEGKASDSQSNSDSTPLGGGSP